jgi:hypothetical protein
MKVGIWSEKKTFLYSKSLKTSKLKVLNFNNSLDRWKHHWTDSISDIVYGVKFEILPTRNASVIEHCFEIGLGEPK